MTCPKCGRGHGGRGHGGYGGHGHGGHINTIFFRGEYFSGVNIIQE